MPLLLLLFLKMDSVVEIMRHVALCCGLLSLSNNELAVPFWGVMVFFAEKYTVWVPVPLTHWSTF